MMTSSLLGVPQPPEPREVAILLAVAGMMAALSLILYLTLRRRKDDVEG
jgi:LPXTG-motif cell wall-anchored protein